MNCLRCQMETSGDYPACQKCAPFMHFEHRADCRCQDAGCTAKRLTAGASFDLECEHCHKPVALKNLTELFTWNWRLGYQSDSISCGQCDGSIRAKAPLIKSQPKRIPGVNFVDGWDI